MTGLYFYDADAADVAERLPPGPRAPGDHRRRTLEYLRRGRLTAEVLGRGILLAGTPGPSMRSPPPPVRAHRRSGGRDARSAASRRSPGGRAGSRTRTCWPSPPRSAPARTADTLTGWSAIDGRTPVPSSRCPTRPPEAPSPPGARSPSHAPSPCGDADPAPAADHRGARWSCAIAPAPADGHAPSTSVGNTRHVTITRAVDGFRLAFDRTGRGPAVVLLHGWPGDRQDYRHVVPLLSEVADVVVPDLEGSAGPTSTRRIRPSSTAPTRRRAASRD